MILCGKTSDDPYATETNSWGDVAFFLTGVLVTGSFALPAVLLSSDVIAWQTLVMSIAGGLVTMAAVIAIIKVIMGGGSSSEMDSW